MTSNVNFLYRKAKNCAKDLNRTNVDLVNLYAKRLDKYDTDKKVCFCKYCLEIRVQENARREAQGVKEYIVFEQVLTFFEEGVESKWDFEEKSTFGQEG